MILYAFNLPEREPRNFPRGKLFYKHYGRVRLYFVSFVLQ